MTIFLTGAAGFLGSHILRRLLELPDIKIKVLIHEKDLSIHDDRIEIIHGSITQHLDLFEWLKGVDIIIHSAAIISFRKMKKKQLFQVNTIGTRFLINAAVDNNVKKFIYISSISAIGAFFQDQHLLTEDFPYNLKELRINYSYSKYLGEFEVQRGQHEGIETIILNPGNIIGPEDPKRSNVGILKLALNSSKYTMKGGIGFVDVRDIAEVVIKSLTLSGDGSRHILISENLTYSDYMKLVVGVEKNYQFFPRLVFRVFGYLSEIVEIVTRIKMPLSVEKGRLHDFYFWGSSEKAKKVFQIQFRPVKESITDMMTWYREKGLI